VTILLMRHLPGRSVLTLSKYRHLFLGIVALLARNACGKRLAAFARRVER
jgi:hypothetical protein